MLAYIISIMLFVIAIVCATVGGFWSGVLEERGWSYRHIYTRGIKETSQLFYVLAVIGFVVAILCNWVSR